MLKAGMSIRDISPGPGEELAGYPHYPRNNTGIHDPLYAACMYLDNGEEELAMVTLDLLFFSKKHVRAVRRAAEKCCGIKGSNIMISCSHTHSGPWASGRLDIESLEAGKQQNTDYIWELTKKITEAIEEAKKQSFEAEFASGTVLCGAEDGIGGNRRCPGGPHDPQVSVMAVRDRKRRVRGIFVNYTLHPTYIHEWSNVVTADYPGYLRIQLKELEEHAVIGFSQGASGNQSGRYYRKGESFEEAERVGRTLGKAAHTVLDKAIWRAELEIRVAGTEIPLELRDFETEEVLEQRVREYKRIYDDLYARYGSSEKREEYYLWQNANLKTLGAEDQLGYIRMWKRGERIELKEDEGPAEIQVIRLGNTCVIGVPGEVFVEYGLYVKAMAGYTDVIFNSLTNGCLPGYLYTPESLAEGGYETDTSMLGRNFGRHMVEQILTIIEKVK